MGKKRIIVTCPVTDIAVITNIAYEDMIKPRRNAMLFACPCGETHRLRFAGDHANLRRYRPVEPDKRGVR